MLYKIIRPLLFSLDAEIAHRFVFNMIKLSGRFGRLLAGFRSSDPHDSRLHIDIAGLQCTSPIGLAAGLDKDGELIDFWPDLGFGFIELGTVTAHPQEGNDRPRLFRLPSKRALINRMGFNNKGSAALAEVLEQIYTFPGPRIPLGVNIGKSLDTLQADAADDYATSAKRVSRLCDYLTVNVSSPNTPGLRDLQHGEYLPEIISAVVENSADRPVFVKLSPDMSARELWAAMEKVDDKVSGYIITNTTRQRFGVESREKGGLSGRPLFALSLSAVLHARMRTELPIIASGGIDSITGVLAAIAVGASAVQLYTGLIYEGPGLIHRINRELSELVGNQTFEEFRTAYIESLD